MHDPEHNQVGGSHYKDLPIQPARYIAKNGIGFLAGCVIKRMTRYNRPTGKGLQDLEKAKHEIELLIKFEKERQEGEHFESDALVSLLRTPPLHDYDGYKAAQLMADAANEIERLRNTIGESRAWFDFNHLDAVLQGKTKLSGDAVRDLRYAYDKLGNVLLAND